MEEKEKDGLFCNTAWIQCPSDLGEKQPENGSLNYNTILQLDLFCKQEEKWDEIHFVQFSIVSE